MGNLVMTLSQQPGDLRILVVVDDKTLARIQRQDPIELDLESLAARHAHKHGVRPARVSVVGIVWASPEDIDKIAGMVKAGRVVDAIGYACRGFKVEPGDHDAGPTPVLEPKGSA